MIKTIKLNKFVNDVIDTIEIDEAFQRRTCWSNEKKRRYIASFVHKLAITPIIVADCESGREFSARKIDFSSEDKYKGLLGRGLKYVSLDGQNRTNALKEFMNNEFTISGEFIDADDLEVIVENQHYKDLSPRLQDKIRDIDVNLAAMEDLLYGKLSDVFVNINDGMPLNPMEIRNAFNTPISETMRNIATSPRISEIWNRTLRTEHVDRMLDVELLLKTFMATHNHEEYNAKNKDMDDFYRLGKDRNLGQVNEYGNQHLIRFANIMELARKIILAKHPNETDAKRARTTPQMYWAIILVAQFLTIKGVLKRDITTSQGKELYEIICKVQDRLILGADQNFAKDREDYDNGIRTDKPSKSHYYTHWASEPLRADTRPKRREKLLESVTANSRFQEIVFKTKESTAA
jgi:hypothetical protein